MLSIKCLWHIPLRSFIADLGAFVHASLNVVTSNCTVSPPRIVPGDLKTLLVSLFSLSLKQKEEWGKKRERDVVLYIGTPNTISKCDAKIGSK